MSATQALLDEMIGVVVKEGSSDLHLTEGKKPVIRVNGYLIPLEKFAPLTKENFDDLFDIFLTAEYQKEFEEKREVNFAYPHKSGNRFRGNVFQSVGHRAVALRLIPDKIKTFDELNLPPVLSAFAGRQQGFFLIVGPAGQGKSTTLASIIEYINNDRLEHIITIEDPIEFLFTPKKSMIDQREVRVDTPDFHTALWGAFRQDADILMVGEMREPTTVATAVTAAETGHLVLSTLHTNDAAQTIDRIIDTFQAESQDQIRYQLAGSLLGIFSIRLIPRVKGGLIPAFELLINNTAVSNLIREKRTHELPSVIETSSEEGMIDFNRSLSELVRKGEVAPESAFRYSTNPRALERML